MVGVNGLYLRCVRYILNLGKDEIRHFEIVINVRQGDLNERKNKRLTNK